MLDLLATQIKIEQPAIKHKWGYWPEPLSLVIDFHFGAAPRLARRARLLDTTFFFLPFARSDSADSITHPAAAPASITAEPSPL